VSGDPLSALVRAADPPLYIVTTVAGGERAGCVVGFATQVSIHPPRFLAALSVENHTSAVARAATHLAVHVVTAEHADLVELFGGETGDEVDKFSRCAWADGPAGVPILGGVAAWFVGTIIERYDFGDHVGHLLDHVAGPAGAEPDGSGAAVVSLGDADDVQAGHPA
jgi:flavin reductase (DIM6/NTAB) family NADH-FMN oxidoreductase RutF